MHFYFLLNFVSFESHLTATLISEEFAEIWQKLPSAAMKKCLMFSLLEKLLPLSSKEFQGKEKLSKYASRYFKRSEVMTKNNKRKPKKT
ncbi:CLUMA_CG019227, isoform A [Clunio marinus]|uniref:CLUMA_CG019227, isoform A n=1 Tax=Clunio marinus TaxID=568069 RepID=A0A1J1J257_9DIPT|nr:CLUMA_CG019227, isoform A [Clunio marinus]